MAKVLGKVDDATLKAIKQDIQEREARGAFCPGDVQVAGNGVSRISSPHSSPLDALLFNLHARLFSGLIVLRLDRGQLLPTVRTFEATSIKMEKAIPVVEMAVAGIGGREVELKFEGSQNKEEGRN